MPYGLYILNGDSRVQIDSSESLEHFVVRSGTGTSASPGDNTAYGNGQDLLFASGTAGGFIGLSDSTTWSPDMTNTTNFFVASSTSYYTPPAPSGNYGLEVYNASVGKIFDSRYYAGSNFEILASGVMPAGGDTSFTINYGNTGFASGDVYCLMNNTKLDITGGSTYQVKCCYVHNAGSDSITVYNMVTGFNIGGNQLTIDPTAIFDMTYLIVGVRD